MDRIRGYILSVICAAIICSVINSMIGSKTTHGTIIRLLSGIFMSVALISPLVNIRLTDYTDNFSAIQANGTQLVSTGQNLAYEQLHSIIKSQTEAYILDKAASMDIVLDVEVKLNQNDPPIPCEVKITGAISPYSKESLSRYITNNLGIAKEDQVWIQ